MHLRVLSGLLAATFAAHDVGQAFARGFARQHGFVHGALGGFQLADRCDLSWGHSAHWHAAQTPIRPRSFSRLSAGEPWTRAPLTAMTPACSRLVIAASTSAGVRRRARYMRSSSRPRTRPTTSRTTKYSVLCMGARAVSSRVWHGRTVGLASPSSWGTIHGGSLVGGTGRASKTGWPDAIQEVRG